jgi:uncharacterized protein YbjT (DUF2867 family)
VLCRAREQLPVTATPATDGPPRVLVLGATGTVGEPLVRALKDRDVTLRVGTRDPESARERFDAGLDAVRFDVRRPETWGPALEGVERCFLLYPPGTDLASIRSVADAADRMGVDRVVFLSILGAQRLPILPHRRIERHLAGTGLTPTFLRASWFFQNLSGIHRPEILEREEIYVPAGSGAVSAVDARDVAAVAAAALTESGHGHRAYDLTGPASLTFDAMAGAFSDVLDRPITYADPDPLSFAAHMIGRGQAPGFVAFMVAEYTAIRLGVGGRTSGDVERVLGREPRSIRAFVSDLEDAFRTAG